MRKQMVGLLTVSFSFLLIFFVALIVSKMNSNQLPLNLNELTKIYAISPKYFAPEPQERLIYIMNILSSPLLCCGLYLFFDYRLRKERIQKVRLFSWLFFPVFLYLIYYIVFLGLNLAAFNYLKPSGLVQYPWITLIVNVCFTVFWAISIKYKNSQKLLIIKLGIDFLYWVLGCLILVLIGAETVFNEAEPYVPHIHFIAYFDSVAQVYLGKSPYINFFPQYGLYAWLLNPIFQIIGLNVLKFTILMGILKVIIYGSFLVLFFELIDNKFLAFLTFATVFFYTRMRVPIDILKDPYFQYNPHRMLFPVLLLLLSWFYLRTTNLRTKKSIYFTNSLLSAFATLWNPDTGVVVTITWIGFLILNELYDFKNNKLKKTLFNIGIHIVILIFGYCLVFGGFIVLTYLKTNQFPNFLHSSDYAKLFYFFGYYMLPMPVVHPWNIVILTYLTGIYFSMQDLLSIINYSQSEINSLAEKENHNNKFIFITSILGIGLFNYYVGRSHEYNLVSTIWPAYILLALFVDRLYKRVTPIFRSQTFSFKIKLVVALKNSFLVGLLVGLCYFLGSTTVSITGNLPIYINLIYTRINQVRQGIPTDISDGTNFIKETSTRNDTVFIISDYAPELYLYTQHARPIDIGGFGEIILMEEVEQIQRFFLNPPQNAKIYWDKRFYDINPYTFRINPYNFSNLIPINQTSNGNIVLFTIQDK